MLTRRAFVQSAVSLSAASAALRMPAQSEATLTLRVVPGEALATIPKDFIGLGYEMSSAARPGLLSPDNQPYVQLLRNLGPSGVLRLGGIVADFTRYDANGTFRAEARTPLSRELSLIQLRRLPRHDRMDRHLEHQLRSPGTLEEAIA